MLAVAGETVTHQLAGQKRHVFNDGQPHPPLGIFCKLNNGREERLGELADPDDLIHTVQIRDYVQANLWTLEEKEGDACHLAV